MWKGHAFSNLHHIHADRKQNCVLVPYSFSKWVFGKIERWKPYPHIILFTQSRKEFSSASENSLFLCFSIFWSSSAQYLTKNAQITRLKTASKHMIWSWKPNLLFSEAKVIEYPCFFWVYWFLSVKVGIAGFLIDWKSKYWMDERKSKYNNFKEHRNSRMTAFHRVRLMLRKTLLSFQLCYLSFTMGSLSMLSF